VTKSEFGELIVHFVQSLYLVLLEVMDYKKMWIWEVIKYRSNFVVSFLLRPLDNLSAGVKVFFTFLQLQFRPYRSSVHKVHKMAAQLAVAVCLRTSFSELLNRF
jgi:hypothetical protein